VLFGELGLSFSEPLSVGTTYAVLTRITSVIRKRGQRIPLFDLVSLDYEIRRAEDGGEVACVSQSWVVSREPRSAS